MDLRTEINHADYFREPSYTDIIIMFYAVGITFIFAKHISRTIEWLIIGNMFTNWTTRIYQRQHNLLFGFNYSCTRIGISR